MLGFLIKIALATGFVWLFVFRLKTGQLTMFSGPWGIGKAFTASRRDNPKTYWYGQIAILFVATLCVIAAAIDLLGYR